MPVYIVDPDDYGLDPTGLTITVRPGESVVAIAALPDGRLAIATQGDVPEQRMPGAAQTRNGAA